MSCRQLGFEDSLLALKSYGIPVLGRAVKTRDEAIRAADELGYPVVLKAATPEIVHKTDVGVVLLDISSAEEAGEAYPERYVDDSEPA